MKNKIWIVYSPAETLAETLANTLEIFLNKPKKNHRPTVVCLVWMIEKESIVFRFFQYSRKIPK